MLTARWGTGTQAARVVTGVVVLGLLGLTLRSTSSSPDPTVQASGVDPLEFACNAGNAGNAGLVRKMQTGPVAAGEVLNGIVTKFGGKTPESLQLFVVRIRGGKVIASGTSRAQTFKPGQIVDASRLGYPGTRGLLPDSDDPLAQQQLRFVEAHVDALAFVDAVEAGRGDVALRALGLQGQDVLVIATVPADLSARRTRFTMHPAAVVLR